MDKPIRIIGAGLAGSEAAWQCARRGVAVQLFEMRPVRSTPAHQTANFAELVCSNSLKSDSENTAPWLLKEEMRRAGSLLMEIARQTAVPAGHALAVDREKFAEAVTAAIEREPLIEIVREEVTAHRRERRDHDCRHRPADFRRADAARSCASAAASSFISTTPSAPSWKPIPSTCRACTWRRATTRAAPTTSTAP